MSVDFKSIRFINYLIYTMTKKLLQRSILCNAFDKVDVFISTRNFILLVLISTMGSLNLSAQAGKDGALTITALNTVLSRYTQPTSNIAAGATTITVTSIADLNRDGIGYLPNGYVADAGGFISNGLSAGDLLMIYQAQGASINITNTLSYGEVTALNGAGTYELARVASVAGNVITLSCATKQAYSLVGHVQIVRVPQYTTLTVNPGASVAAVHWGAPEFGGVDPSASERRRGGFNALLANNIINNGSINANGAGFRGGTRDNNTTGPDANFYTDFVTQSDALSAEKGESIAGYRVDYDTLGGRYGRGAAANGGGGGNAHNAGGGGGANGGNLANWFRGAGVMESSGSCGTIAWTLDPNYLANNSALTNSSGGGHGGYTFGLSEQDACTYGPSYPASFISPGVPAENVSNTNWGGDNRGAIGGLGGRPVTSTTFQNRIIFGGGGGAGDGNNNASNDGGDGGGIVFLLTSAAISGTGNIQANGQTALNTIASGNDAPGGGGGGGTILIQSPAINAQAIQANGGAGGNQIIGNNESEGPGGGGGGGVVAIKATTDASIKEVSGGKFGTSDSSSVTEFPANGATSGNEGTTANINEAISVCGVCFKPAATGGTALDTKMGITALNRAGVENGNWPMVRKGAHVALEAKTKGFVPTRVSNPVTSITAPVDGMMVYDTALNCLRIYVVDTVTPANTGWKCFDTQTCPD